MTHSACQINERIGKQRPLCFRPRYVYLHGNDENPVDVGNARLGRGFFCWNSETGVASFGLTIFLHNYVYGNHIVWGAEEVRELRIVHKGEALDRFHNLAQSRLNQFVENRAYSDTVKETVSRALSEPIAKDLAKTLEWFKDRLFTKGEVTKAWETGIAEGNDVTTIWGMVQGLTAQARSLPYTNWRVNLERRAGSLPNFQKRTFLKSLSSLKLFFLYILIFVYDFNIIF